MCEIELLRALIDDFSTIPTIAHRNGESGERFVHAAQVPTANVFSRAANAGRTWRHPTSSGQLSSPGSPGQR